VDEAHRLAKMAVQMSSNRKKGLAWSVSTRGGGASSAEKRMDLDRLVEFLNQVSAAPCRVPEAELLQVRDVTETMCMSVLSLSSQRLLEFDGLVGQLNVWDSYSCGL